MAKPTYNLEGLFNALQSSAQLVPGGAPAASVTRTNADTDYTLDTALPDGTAYVVFYCASAFKAAMGEDTSSSVGVWVGAGSPAMFPVARTGVADSDKIHVQSPTAGAVVTVTFMHN